MNLSPPMPLEETRTDYEIGLDEGRSEQASRITELEKDAARWVWFADHFDNLYTTHNDVYTCISEGFTKRELLVAIDAAIAKEMSK